MSQVSKVFRRFIPQLLHMFILPVFFFVFMMIYHPFNSVEFFDGEWYGVHVTISTSIILLSIMIMRLLYYYLPLRLNYTLYITWCFGEVIFASFFIALYVWLVRSKPMPYFEAFTISFQYLSTVLVFPYVILALSMRLHEFLNRSDFSSGTNARIKFYDERHNLKIVLAEDSILYINAEENYVNIHYQENAKIKNYVLRCSMKSLDEICQNHRLIRCHRSYYVNPMHVTVLRKDKDGTVHAELDARDEMHIPVTKRYYNQLTEML